MHLPPPSNSSPTCNFNLQVQILFDEVILHTTYGMDLVVGAVCECGVAALGLTSPLLLPWCLPILPFCAKGVGQGGSRGLALSCVLRRPLRHHLPRAGCMYSHLASPTPQ